MIILEILAFLFGFGIGYYLKGKHNKTKELRKKITNLRMVDPIQEEE